MTRFLLWPLCALISIGAGGAAGHHEHRPWRYPATWGSGFFPDAGDDLRVARRAQNPERRPAAPRRCRARGLAEIARDESGGDYGAQNRRSSASGRYQVLDSTWSGYGGFVKARLAPPEVQEAQAAELYRLAGARPWDASC